MEERRGEGHQKNRRNDPRDSLPAPSPRDDRSGEAGLRAALSDPLELAREVGGILPPILRIFGQTFLYDSIERRRRHRLDLGDRLRLVAQDRRDERRLRRPRKCLLPGRHLVEHRPQSEDVRPRIRLLPLELFRRHVLERPKDRPLRREGLLLGRQRGDGAAEHPAFPQRHRFYLSIVHHYQLDNLSVLANLSGGTGHFCAQISELS
jgi:hypothetical protein